MACIDPATNDLRLDVADYGERELYGDFRALGSRRIAGTVQILQGSTVLAELHQTIAVAGDLVPSAILADVPPAALNRKPEPRFCWHAWPGEMRYDMESLDVHLVPPSQAAIQQHAPMVVARVLVGTDGKVADLELLYAATPALRGRARDFLRTARFRRREWQGRPVLTEGLLLLGPP